jgi:hypothetical protein
MSAAAVPGRREALLAALRRHRGPRIYVAPEIPEAIAEGARDGAGESASGRELLAVFDETLAENGRNGLYFFEDSLVVRSVTRGPQRILYADLKGRTPKFGVFVVRYGPGIEVEANMAQKKSVAGAIADILAALED